MTHGSSPLARGLPGGGGHGRAGLGIIPARAGFTTYPPPRSASSGGSSPLARGLPGDQPGRAHGRRIIPARAGFTPRRSARIRGRGDHPRSRGVYFIVIRPDSGPVGSSPLARGLPGRDLGCGVAVRIIPARAGFTTASTSGTRSAWDHPRSRGVYRQCPGSAHSRQGSSPLARGLQRAIMNPTTRDGIIPARAGFTSGPTTPPAPPTDHPRSRGVYVTEVRPAPARFGSSPLARGLRRRP